MTPKSQSRRYHLGTRATLWLLVLQAGCLYGGPKSVYRDRFDYSTALADSWKQQLLLNIVKARYMDPPIFIDVAQVVTSYTNEGQANFSGNTASGSPASRTIGVNGRWAESPTITYNPLQGEQFTKSLLTPIPPRALFSMVQAGWPIDAVLGIGVRIMNGLYATSSTAALQNRGDTSFYKVLRMLREEQMNGALSLRVSDTAAAGPTVMVIRNREVNDSLLAKGRTVRQLLHLAPDVQEFSLAFAAVQQNDSELAVVTRSMLEILNEAASGVEVPPVEVSEGRATPALDSAARADAGRFRVRVHASESEPASENAFVAVHYRRHWFWIDDRDIAAKRSMGFLLTLFTLAESGTTMSPPVLTITKP